MTSWLKAGTGCSINGSTLTHTTNTDWKTAYGVQEVSAGKHEWKVKMNKCLNYVLIGVTSNTNHSETTVWSRNDTFSYMYYSYNGNLLHKDGDSAYSQKFGDGDIITVHLDLDNNTIEFSKNGNRLGIAPSNIQSNQQYRLTACILCQGTNINVTSYINLSEEQKEEPKAQNMNDNYMKQSTTFITKQYDYLNVNFTNDKIKQFDVEKLNDSTKYLCELNDDIKKLEIELKKCQSKLMESQSVLQEYTKLDIGNYAKWSMKQVEIWLSGLEGGRYQQYIPKLIKGFKNDKITASDLPDLDQGDLRSFDMEIFKDRKNLRAHFQGLKKGKEGSQTVDI